MGRRGQDEDMGGERGHCVTHTLLTESPNDAGARRLQRRGSQCPGPAARPVWPQEDTCGFPIGWHLPVTPTATLLGFIPEKHSSHAGRFPAALLLAPALRHNIPPLGDGRCKGSELPREPPTCRRR